MPQSIRKVIVTDALIRSGQGYLLHPGLHPWQSKLLQSRWQWFSAEAMLPLQWYGQMHAIQPVSLIATRLESAPEGAVQCFIASPYHAQMARDRILVLPEAMFQWSEAEGKALCDALNPLLAEDGLSLVPVGIQLLLFSKRKLDVLPASFAALSGKQLPNRHPEGADGAFLMRLMAEVQMLVHSSPMHTSSQSSPLHGLWFWGGCDLPCDPLPIMKAVATRNPSLRTLCEGRDAAIAISEADHLPELLKEDSMPEQWILGGEDVALLATSRSYPWFSHKLWKPQNVQAYMALKSVLEGF